MSVADEIKARLDIVAYIQQYVPLKRAGKSYKACCPWHGEKTPSFVVDPTRQSFRCFGACAVGGDVISFAMRHHGWSFSEALQELGKQVGVEVKQRTPEQRSQDDRLDGLRGLLTAAADAFHQTLINPENEEAAAALAYARDKRGFSNETIQQYKIGYALSGFHNMLDYLKQLGYTEDQIVETGMAVRNENERVYDRFRNRLMIPIRDERGRVTGFGARALNPDDNPKYLNSPQTPLFDKSKTLFGLDTAKSAIRENETAVIVEGYMDAITAHQAGFKNVVAQMGTALTETQIRILTRTAKKLILALDSDAAGQNATRRSLETAREALQADFGGRLGVDIRILHIPGAKDPDELIRETPERWNELVKNAIPVAEFVIDMETAGLPPNATLQEREALARRVLPILVASENDLYTKDNVQLLARRLHIAERDLLGWADEQRRLAKAKAPKPRPSEGKSRTSDLHPTAHTEGDLEPPDMPPLAYDDRDAPPEEWDSSPLTSLPHPEGKQPNRAGVLPGIPNGRRQEAAIEAYCLRMLFQRPEAYYAVNRKLRELAGTRRELHSGPLCDWQAEDFSQTETRALMQTFLEALEQDDLEPLVYLHTYADPSLQPQLELILRDELQGMRARLGDGLTADLMFIWDYNRPPAVDVNAELVEKALQLRARRLQREREELVFLQVDMNQDDEAGQHFQERIALSSMAKGLIDAELNKQMSALRE